MGKGGGISNYIVNGKTLVDSKSALFRDGFVSPVMILQRPYEFCGWEATDAGAAVTLKYKLGAKDIAQLKGLTVTKRYVFGEKAVTLHTELKNEGNRTVSFAYRSHNIPSLFTLNGSLKFADGKILSRMPVSVFHPAKGYTGTCFNSKPGDPCSGSSAVFSGNEGTMKITWQIPNFIGVYRWDAQNSPVSSFELATAGMTLQPGQSMSLTFTLQ